MLHGRLEGYQIREGRVCADQMENDMGDFSDEFLVFLGS